MKDCGSPLLLFLLIYIYVFKGILLHLHTYLVTCIHILDSQFVGLCHIFYFLILFLQVFISEKKKRNHILLISNELLAF